MSELDNRDMFRGTNAARNSARRRLHTMSDQARGIARRIIREQITHPYESAVNEIEALMVRPRQDSYTPDPPPRSRPCELRPGWRYDREDRMFRNDGRGILVQLTEQQYREMVLEEHVMDPAIPDMRPNDEMSTPRGYDGFTGMYHSIADNSRTFLTSAERDEYDRVAFSGPVGPTGSTGGPVGQQLHSGNDDPDPQSGSVGDYFLCVRTGFLWVKVGPVTWERGENISSNGSTNAQDISDSGGSGAGGFSTLSVNSLGHGGGGGGGGGVVSARGISAADMSFAGADRLMASRPIIPNPGESTFDALVRQQEQDEPMRRAQFELNQRLLQGKTGHDYDSNDSNDISYGASAGAAMRGLRAAWWAWKTIRMRRRDFPDKQGVRIKDDAPICWKGRSGEIVETQFRKGMDPDMVTVKLYGGVVGTPYWTCRVSLYDLILLSETDTITEQSTWGAHINRLTDEAEATRRGIATERAKAERERQERIEKPIKVEAVIHGARRRLIID